MIDPDSYYPAHSSDRCGICNLNQLERQSAQGKTWVRCPHCEESGPSVDFDGETRPPGPPLLRERAFAFVSPIMHGYVVAPYAHVDDFSCFVELSRVIRRRDWEASGSSEAPRNEKEARYFQEALLDLRGELTALFLATGWEGDGELQAFFIPPFFCHDGDTHCAVGYHVKQMNNGTSFLAVPDNVAIHLAGSIYADEYPKVPECAARDNRINQVAHHLQRLSQEAPRTQMFANGILAMAAMTIGALDCCRGSVICVACPQETVLSRWVELVRPLLLEEAIVLGHRPDFSADFWERFIRKAAGLLQGRFRRDEAVCPPPPAPPARFPFPLGGNGPESRSDEELAASFTGNPLWGNLAESAVRFVCGAEVVMVGEKLYFGLSRETFRNLLGEILRRNKMLDLEPLSPLESLALEMLRGGKPGKARKGSQVPPGAQ